MTPFATTDDAWAALVEQQGMSDGEAVDLWEHQLQTADALERLGADDELIVAGLLHDLGDGRAAESAHAAWAAALVRPLLGERVAWLIGAHADAKRYLCTADPTYWSTLSPVSQRTLDAQGGRMSPAEMARFEAHPYAQDALLLRECDDGGKDPARRVHNPERFRALLDRVAARQPCKHDRDPATERLRGPGHSAG
ncbi:MAG: HD domain-containing protein [Chloroflexi bacterium]|nr:HD domain-containing protein [Chloroflexota bacterium]